MTQKLRIGIAATHLNRDLYFERPDLDRLANLGEVIFREFEVPTDWHSILKVMRGSPAS